MAHKSPESVYDIIIGILPFLDPLARCFRLEINRQTLVKPGEPSRLNNPEG
jgi:hypothetical protein